MALPNLISLLLSGMTVREPRRYLKHDPTLDVIELLMKDGSDWAEWKAGRHGLQSDVRHGADPRG